MKSIFLKIVVFLILIFSISINSYSQNVNASAEIDTNNVLIGDQVHLLLQVQSNRKIPISWFPLLDSIGHLEIVNKSKIDTVVSTGKYIQKQIITLTCFDSGTYQIPPIRFLYGKEGFDTYTQSVNIKFNPVKVDTSKSIKGIKSPIDIPWDFWDYFPYLAIILGIILILGLIYYFYVKRKPKDIFDLDYDPSIPPHVLALESLKQLESEKLWQNGHVKKYYIKLTDIIRIYIKRQFKIDATEMISSEIIIALKSNRFESQLVSKLKFLFDNSDLVKFAKFKPLPDTNAKSIEYAYDFVKQSIPINTNSIEEQAKSDTDIPSAKEDENSQEKLI